MESGSQKQSSSEGPGGWQAAWAFRGDLSQSHSGPWGREDLSDLPVIGRGLIYSEQRNRGQSTDGVERA